MKTSLIRLCVAFAWLAAFGPGAFAAVTFTITPPAVSNTYSKTISFAIAGLTNRETVVIQKFLDLNTNGIIDGGDWLVQQFTLQDGTNFVIGGVTNFNVPGDLNATMGAITATLNFQNGDFMQNIVGKYLYKLSSPGGHFTPITNSFSVTNFPFPQKFTGNVVSNGTSATVSNAVVLLFPPPVPGDSGPSGSPLAGVVANHVGSYTVQAPPGTYELLSFRSNFVANMDTAPVVTLAASQTITTNLTLTNATSSISGSVVDLNNSSIGLPGVLIPAMSSNSLIAIALTDTNGNFKVPVTAGAWRIKGDDTTLIVHGYLGLQNKSSTNAGATGVTIAVPKATALIYGSVKDSLGNPLVGLDVYASDDNNLYQTDGYTDANGNYVLGVLGLGSNDFWWLDANDNNQLTNYIFSQETINGNINAGQAVLQNFNAILATNHVTGWLKDNSGNPIAGVGVFASATINGVDYNVGTVGTDSNGNYSLNVGNGTWTVQICSGEDSDPLPGNYLCSQSQSAVISNNNATNNFTALLATNFITGHVQQSNGNPIGGVGVWASALINGTNFYQNVDTDGGGNYLLYVINGTWDISLSCNNDRGSDCLDNILGSGNYTCPNDQTAVINNNNATNNFIVQPYGVVSITTTSLPPGEVSGYYDQFLSATTAYPPATWSLISGSLPPGLTGNPATGEIYGTPTNAGTFNFTVQVTDNNSQTANQALSLTISAPVQVTTASLPNGSQGGYYSASLAALGGQSPYLWSLSPGSGSLPPGLTMTTDGILSGTPTSLGTFYFFVRVTDAAMGTDDQLLSLTVKVASSLQVTTKTLPEGAQGAAYSQQLAASGGQPPYLWSLSPGSDSLPPGLTLSTNGILSGAPAGGGIFYFFARVTDAALATADQLLSLSVLNVATTSLPGGVQGAAYSQQLVATNGQPPYLWSLSPGSASLPPGLTLSTNGILSGCLSASGVFAFSVRVTDGASLTASQSLSLVTVASFQTLLQIPTLSMPTLLHSGGCQLTVGGIGGQYYTLEYSTNLTDWIPLCGTNISGSSFTYTDFPAAGRCRFYRACASGSAFSFSQTIYCVSATNGSALISAAQSGGFSYNASVTNGSALVSVVRSGGLSSGLYVQYSTTTSGTATAGVDYSPVSGTLYFPPNVASNSFSVPILSSSNTNQDVTVVLQMGSLDGKITQYAVLDIQRPQSLPAPVPVVYPGSLTFVLPENCAQTITVSNAGPPGSMLNYFVTDNGALGGFFGYQIFNSDIWGRYVIGSLPGGTCASFQVEVMPDSAAFFENAEAWQSSGLLPSPQWPLVTTVINVYMLGANPQSSEIPAVAIYPVEITTADRVYGGTWCGTWSGTEQAGTWQIGVNGAWTLQISSFTYTDGGLSGVSGSFTWQGTDMLFDWEGATNSDGSPDTGTFTPIDNPVNLTWSLTGWGAELDCGGGLVLTPPDELTDPSSGYTLEIGEFELNPNGQLGILDQNGQIGSSENWDGSATPCACVSSDPVYWPAWSHGGIWGGRCQ